MDRGARREADRMVQGRARRATIAEGATALVLGLCLGSCVPAQGLEPRFVAVHNALTAMGMAQTGAINEGMPRYVVEKITDALNRHRKSVRGSRVHILGVVFRLILGQPLG